MQTEMLKLSIVVPVYNAQQYLCECIDALLDQGLSASEYEIVCVNDGSTDDSEKILSDYADHFAQFKFICQENQGVSATRNTGIMQAKGEYIAFVDADDVPLRNTYSKVLQKCFEYDADILYFDYYQGKEFFEPDNNDGQLCESVALPSALTCVWRQVVRRDYLLANDIKFDVGLKVGEDLWFNEKMLCFHPRVCHYHKKCYFYRNHISCWQSNEPEAVQKKLDGMLQIAVLCERFLDEHPQLEQEHRERIIDRKTDCVAAALIYSLSLKTSDTVALMQQLKEQKLYPYKLRKFLFKQKKNKTNMLKVLLNNPIVVRLCAKWMHN